MAWKKTNAKKSRYSSKKKSTTKKSKKRGAGKTCIQIVLK